MKNNMKRIVCIVLALLLVLSLTACGKKGEAPEQVNVMVLNGTTGFGMAQLIHNAAGGEVEQTYNFSIETDASNITAALVSGSVDIAALPTNAASAVYNKTKGGVKVLALNTRGVLYLVSGGESVTSISELKGKTVYAPAQNPTFILTYLCEANGLVVGEDVIIDNTYAQPADLRTALAAGQVELAVLPEPMVTVALDSNEALSVQLDLSEQWDAVAIPGTLVQGCVVVRSDFAKKYPEAVDTFLREYESSISLCTTNPDMAASYIEETGIVPSADIARDAMTRCNLCYYTGEDMKARLSGYLELMAQVDASGIGGKVPEDDFYYIP